jgi:putative endonuclease
MIRHNKGEVFSTQKRLPVTLVLTIIFHDKYKAYKVEKYLKSGSGRPFVRKHFFVN